MEAENKQQHLPDCETVSQSVHQCTTFEVGHPTAKKCDDPSQFIQILQATLLLSQGLSPDIIHHQGISIDNVIHASKVHSYIKKYLLNQEEKQ